MRVEEAEKVYSLMDMVRVDEAEKVYSLLDMVDNEEVNDTSEQTAPPSGVSLISRSSTFPV